MVRKALFLDRVFQEYWKGQDPFTAAFAIQGQIYRELEQRQTLAFTVAGQRYFIKRHRGVKVGEILKNLVQLRLPVVSARNEWVAIGRLQALGVRVPQIAAYGCRGFLPSRMESFLVTEDLGAHVSLEDHCRHWAVQAPALPEKRRLLGQVAELARTMHAAGVCHRDFYLCHLLLMPGGDLTVIDLHRALSRTRTGQRWLIKDLAGLRYSAMDIGLDRKDLLRFIRSYRQLPLRRILREEGKFWRRVESRAGRMYRKLGGA